MSIITGCAYILRAFYLTLSMPEALAFSVCILCAQKLSNCFVRARSFARSFIRFVCVTCMYACMCVCARLFLSLPFGVCVCVSRLFSSRSYNFYLYAYSALHKEYLLRYCNSLPQPSYRFVSYHIVYTCIFSYIVYLIIYYWLVRLLLLLFVVTLNHIVAIRFRV